MDPKKNLKKAYSSSTQPGRVFVLPDNAAGYRVLDILEAIQTELGSAAASNEFRETASGNATGD